MTSSIWPQIVVIITTFIATVTGAILAPLITARMSQPKPKPIENQPRNTIQIWFDILFSSPWLLPPLGILANIYALHLELGATSPVTRWAVLRISLFVAGIVMSVVLFFAANVYRFIKSLVGLLTGSK